MPDLEKTIYVAEVLSGLRQHEALREYSPKTRVAVGTWAFHGIIENGGLKYLFGHNYTDDDYRFVVDGYRQLGLADLADALQSVIDHFPGKTVPHGEGMTTALASMAAKDVADLMAMQTHFFGTGDRLTRAVFSYIKKWKKDFEAERR